VLLEKHLTGYTRRRANHCNRPVYKVRQHPLGDAFVVPDEFEFADATRKVNDPLGMRDLYLRDRSRLQRFAGFTHYAVRGLIDTQALEGSLPDNAFACPLRKLDFGNQLWMYPTFSAGGTPGPAAWL
jgi:hypothetical protein